VVGAQACLRLPTVVIATRDRRQRLLATLAHLDALAERPPVVVVDNASSDGTVAAARRRFPGVEVIESGDHLGAAARTLGVEVADTPLVAFSDDDSWWAPGALRRAAELFQAYPRLGLIAARIIVEPDGRLDPTCHGMRVSPLEHEPDLPGPPVLGFLACAAIARREAVLACGGFHARYGFGGEEHLLAVDLATAGWGLAYVDGCRRAPPAGVWSAPLARRARTAQHALVDLAATSAAARPTYDGRPHRPRRRRNHARARRRTARSSLGDARAASSATPGRAAATAVAARQVKRRGVVPSWDETRPMRRGRPGSPVRVSNVDLGGCRGWTCYAERSRRPRPGNACRTRTPRKESHAWDELEPRKFAAFERELDGLSGQTMEDQ